MIVNLLEDAVLERLVPELVAVYKPIKIYLFGSRSRGDHEPGSDYDIMLIVPDDSPKESRSFKLIYPFLWQEGIAADVLVWTEAEFDGRLHLEASFPSSVVREGKLLYGS